MIPLNHNGLSLPPDPLNRSLMISETRWDASHISPEPPVSDHTNTHISKHTGAIRSTCTRGRTRRKKIWYHEGGEDLFCTWVMDDNISLAYAWLSDNRSSHLTWLNSVCGGRVRKRIDFFFFFRGPVGRQVPQLQTSTVCLLIRSPGCHSTHHPACTPHSSAQLHSSVTIRLSYSSSDD